mgnify:CR=1 FL=1
MNKPYMTKRHLVLEILSYVLLLVCFIIAIVGMATLPDEIPTHFTMSGEIDGYGSPGTLLILPIIMLICNGMTSLIMHVMPPTMWNTPSKLKPQNAVRALQDMISMIEVINEPKESIVRCDFANVVLNSYNDNNLIQ